MASEKVCESWTLGDSAKDDAPYEGADRERQARPSTRLSRSSEIVKCCPLPTPHRCCCGDDFSVSKKRTMQMRLASLRWRPLAERHQAHLIFFHPPPQPGIATHTGNFSAAASLLTCELTYNCDLLDELQKPPHGPLLLVMRPQDYRWARSCVSSKACSKSKDTSTESLPLCVVNRCGTCLCFDASFRHRCILQYVRLENVIRQF